MLTKAVTKASVKRVIAGNNACASVVTMQSSNLSSWNKDDPKSIQGLVTELANAQGESAKTVVPWFLNNMPVCKLSVLY